MILYYLLVSILPLARHPLWTMYVGEFTVIKYVGAACLGVALLHILTRRRVPPLAPTWGARFFYLLLAIAVVSHFTEGLPFSWEHSPSITYVSFLLLLLVTLILVDSRRRLRWTLLVAIGSVAWASLYVLREFQKHGGRPGWVVGDPNYYTISALLAVPLGYYFLRLPGPAWQRRYCLACLILTLSGVTLASSRGGFLGLSAAVFFVALRSTHRARTLTSLALVIGPLLVLAPQSPITRFLEPARGDFEAVEIRQVLWEAGLQIIREHPLAGIGLGNFTRVVPVYQGLDRPFSNVAHNTYIEIAAEMGLPALILFLGILITTFGTLERARQKAAVNGQRFLILVASGLQAGLLAYAVNGFFISAQYQKLMWLMVFLAWTLPRLLHAPAAYDPIAETGVPRPTHVAAR